MELNVYIVDDQLFAVNILSEYVGKTKGLKLVKATTNPYEAVNDLSNPDFSVDVCFMDIRMKGFDGLQLAAMVKEKLLIVFTTGMKMYALASHEYDPVDYLVKPISYEKFLLTVHKIWTRLSKREVIPKNTHKDYIFIPGDKDMVAVKIDIGDIVYFESSSNYCWIHLRDQSKKLVYTSIKELEDTFDRNVFIRPHRSYLVNMDYVFGINADSLVLKPLGGENLEIPIGKTYRELIKTLIK